MAAVTWSVKVVPGQTSQAPRVSLALPDPLVNQLHMVYLGASNKKIRHAVYAGDKWTAEGIIANQSSQAPPALAALGNQLLMVYLGEHDQKIRHALFAGGNWTPKGIVKDQAGQNEQSSQAPPALVALGNQLHIVYIGEHDQKIRHAIGTIT